MRTFEEFSSYITNHDWLEGFVSVSMKPLPPDGNEWLSTTSADWLSSSLGLATLGNRWQCVSVEEFTLRLEGSLKLSLAFSVEMLPPDEASRVVQEFLGFFDSPSAFLVNGTQHSWNPITKSTMETAYIVVSGTQAGMFLFEDED